MKEHTQLAQQIIDLSGGKENITLITNCMTRVRLEVKDMDLVNTEKIKGLKGVFGVYVDAQVQVVVGPGTAKKVADEALAIWGGASRQTSQPTETYQADKEKAKEIAAKNKQAIKSKQKVSKV